MKLLDLLDLLSRRPVGVPVLQGADRAWDATTLLSEIDTLATRLASGRVVAVLADNGPAWVMADLAALKAGKVHLPLPGFFSPAQVLHALNQTGADVVLTDQPERIESLDARFLRTGTWQGLTCMERSVEPVNLPPGTAKVSFTSGSTGTPKGVCLSGEGLLATAQALAERLGDLALARHLAVLPLSLLLENVAGIYAPLLLGAEIHVPPLQTLGWQGMAGFQPAMLHQAVSASRANSLILVPELAKAWILYLEAGRLHAPADLAYVAVGGARVDPTLLERGHRLSLPIYQGYGLTECGSVVSLNRPGDEGTGVGRPLGHVAIHIEDGEVCIRAKAFLGYLGTDAPSSSGEFRTGDTGKFDAAGHLNLDGRRKNLLITSYGRNISPEWVEATLLADPAIAQAIVVGDGRPFLTAILVPAGNPQKADLAAIVAHTNLALPDYARLGNWITAEPFTPQNGLATGNGRPMRQAIHSRYAAEIESIYQEEESPLCRSMKP